MDLTVEIALGNWHTTRVRAEEAVRVRASIPIEAVTWLEMTSTATPCPHGGDPSGPGPSDYFSDEKSYLWPLLGEIWTRFYIGVGKKSCRDTVLLITLTPTDPPTPTPWAIPASITENV